MGERTAPGLSGKGFKSTSLTNKPKESQKARVSRKKGGRKGMGPFLSYSSADAVSEGAKGYIYHEKSYKEAKKGYAPGKSLRRVKCLREPDTAMKTRGGRALGKNPHKQSPEKIFGVEEK